MIYLRYLEANRLSIDCREKNINITYDPIVCYLRIRTSHNIEFAVMPPL